MPSFREECLTCDHFISGGTVKECLDANDWSLRTTGRCSVHDVQLRVLEPGRYLFCSSWAMTELLGERNVSSGRVIKMHFLSRLVLTRDTIYEAENEYSKRKVFLKSM